MLKFLINFISVCKWSSMDNIAHVKDLEFQLTPSPASFCLSLPSCDWSWPRAPPPLPSDCCPKRDPRCWHRKGWGLCTTVSWNRTLDTMRVCICTTTFPKPEQMYYLITNKNSMTVERERETWKNEKLFSSFFIRGLHFYLVLLPTNSWASQMALVVKNPSTNAG